MQKNIIRLFAFLLLPLLSRVVFGDEAATAAAPAAAPAPTLDTGDTAWILISTALVFFMTPGLALFYGGLVRAKNVLNIMMKSFVAISIVSLTWVIVGYSLAFSAGNPFVGGLEWAMLAGIKLTDLAPLAPTIPHLLFVVFQLVFAIITAAIISGSVAERMKFSAFVLFMTIWSIVVYAPLAHMVWGGGYIGATIGALDFAGGTVVHISSGFSGLVLAILLGRRTLTITDDPRPHNLPLTLLGASILWFGWFGFNAGSAVASNGLAANAFLVTHVAAAAAALVWVLIEWILFRKPTALGFASGAVAGLVAITPAAGFVDLTGALILGVVVSPLCLFGIRLKNQFGYDDTLDAFGIHGIGGIWGALGTGLFAQTSINSLAANGLFYGGGTELLMKQLLGVLIAIGIAVIGTLVIAFVIKLVVGLRVEPESEQIGLDTDQHGEAAYGRLN